MRIVCTGFAEASIRRPVGRRIEFAISTRILARFAGRLLLSRARERKTRLSRWARLRRLAPGVHPTAGMTMQHARESLQLCLRLAAAPGNGAYKVTIELFEIDLVVESIDLDLKGAVRSAADRCAEQLRERGYAVTATDVIGALEEALEATDGAPKLRRDQLN